jgi:hypothetical protein
LLDHLSDLLDRESWLEDEEFKQVFKESHDAIHNAVAQKLRKYVGEFDASPAGQAFAKLCIVRR